MLRMLVRNKVKDYRIWKEAFDSDAARGREYGLTLEHLWQNQDDPNEVFFVMLVEDRQRAQAFIETPESAEVGEKAGVIDGEYYYVDDGE